MKCNLRNDIKDTSFSISQSHISNVIIKPIQNVKQMRTDLIDMETSNLIWGKSYIAWTQDPMLATDVMFLVIFYINEVLPVSKKCCIRYVRENEEFV